MILKLPSWLDLGWGVQYGPHFCPQTRIRDDMYLYPFVYVYVYIIYTYIICLHIYIYICVTYYSATLSSLKVSLGERVAPHYEAVIRGSGPDMLSIYQIYQRELLVKDGCN